jgi:hypothetical protein
MGANEDGTVSNSSSSGSVLGSQNTVGGLVGYNYNRYEGSIFNSYSTSRVNASGRVGGLLGNNEQGEVRESYATGLITGTGDNIGDLIGYNGDSTVINSSASGKVTGDLSVGSLVGENLEYADIKSSH